MILGKDKHDTAMSWKRQGMVSSFLALEKTRELICCQLSCFGKDEIYACYVLEKASICRGFGKDYPISSAVSLGQFCCEKKSCKAVI